MVVTARLEIAQNLPCALPFASRFKVYCDDGCGILRER